MRKKLPPGTEQPSLFDLSLPSALSAGPQTDELHQAEKKQAAQWERQQKQMLHLSESDMQELRTWLLKWGEQHNYPAFSFPFSPGDPLDRRVGLLYGTKERWEHDVQPPLAQREFYPGEWLVKCVKHVKCIDAGEISLPEQLSRYRLDESQDE